MMVCPCENGWVCSEHPRPPWHHSLANDKCMADAKPRFNIHCEYGRKNIVRAEGGGRLPPPKQAK